MCFTIRERMPKGKTRWTQVDVSHYPIRIKARRDSIAAAAAEEKARRLEAEILIAAEIAKGCESQAVFKKMMWPFGWVLSVSNAGAIYVDDLFPQDKNKIKRALEQIGAGDPVYYADFLGTRASR